MNKNKIFLTSFVGYVAHDIPRFIEQPLQELRLAFIDTATEVEKGDLEWINEDKNSLIKAGFNLFDFTISGKNEREIRETLDKVDVLYFSGGNQFYLLAKIQESNCHNLIRNYVKNGKIYIGSSAGSIIAGPDIYPTRLIDEVKKAGILNSYKGLGLVDFIVLPHWGSDDFKDVYLNQRLEITYNSDYKFILLRDNQYIRVKDGWYQIVSV